VTDSDKRRFAPLIGPRDATRARYVLKKVIMPSRKRRRFGERINFKSLSCAPINEQGVVYLFGVLHEVFDFKVELIQTGFPDCIARRKIDKNKYEELKIEFEFESSSFVKHKHNPNEIDIIICWEHNWKECPKHIEVIELSSMLENAVNINEEIKKPKKLSEYNPFCQEHRLKGISFSEIAKLWENNRLHQIAGAEPL